MTSHRSQVALEAFISRIFSALGADSDVMSEVARHLVRANLSGHDSHGVIRVAQYVAQVDSGGIVPAARPFVLRESSVTALIDARRSFGLYSTMFALDWAVGRARQHGTATTVIRHTSHIGRLGEYVEKGAAQGFVVIITAGAAGPASGGMLLFGGTQRFFGANPWCIGVPVADGPSLVFDGSTSTIAEGKVRMARAKGAKLSADCIVDAQGRASDNPEDFYAGGALVPLGGAVGGHKGSGLAFMSALLGALCMIDDDAPTLIGGQMRAKAPDERGRAGGVFISVIDPACFGSAAHYREMISETVAAARRVPPAAGVERILMPGEFEVLTREKRTVEGLQIPDPVWRDLVGIASRCGVEIPGELQ
jgi:uncharacterized oxidoreductase